MLTRKWRPFWTFTPVKINDVCIFINLKKDQFLWACDQFLLLNNCFKYFIFDFVANTIFSACIEKMNIFNKTSFIVVIIGYELLIRSTLSWNFIFQILWFFCQQKTKNLTFKLVFRLKIFPTHITSRFAMAEKSKFIRNIHLKIFQKEKCLSAWINSCSERVTIFF